MASVRIAIVDCGGANIASLRNALKRLGAPSVVTKDAKKIGGSSHVIIPGVGHAGNAMNQLRHANLVDIIGNLKQPVLGICLGMQLLAQYSEEEETECLGIVHAKAVKLVATPELPVPNIGWCKVGMVRPHSLFAGIDDLSYFYFVHSYALECGQHTLATAVHTDSFTAALEHDNFFATQFHPEKSAAPGAQVLKNFLRIGQ